jgi:hypothetical protein
MKSTKHATILTRRDATPANALKGQNMKAQGAALGNDAMQTVKP